MQKVLLLALCFLLGLASAATIQKAGCTVSSKGVMTVELDVDYDSRFSAWATFEDSLHEVGWGKLHVQTIPHPQISDLNTVKCAGLIEGALTHTRISQHFKIYKNDTLEDLSSATWPKALLTYFTANLDWTKQMIAANYQSDQWWRAAGRVFYHTEAIYNGYMQYRSSSEQSISYVEWFILQAAGDMDDITVFLPGLQDLVDLRHKKLGEADFYDFHSHCSALIALKSDYSDLFFSQDTWTAYNQINRILKDYNFQLNERTAATRSTFSGHPGLSFSMDDFWITDAGLLVLETTVHTWNTSLYAACTPKSALNWIRVQVANRLADNGQLWTQHFNRENSWTYNNQYLVVDTNVFVSGQKPTKDLVWGAEQVPGLFVAQDRTKELADNLYIPGINTPAYKSVYEASGYPQKVIETQCGYWDYWNCSRYQIMKRDQPLFTKSFEDFKKFMRYNDWEHDALSNGDAAESILSRYDLRPEAGVHMGTMVGHRNSFGGTDSKCTNIGLAKNLQFDAINSPQYETQPAWQFGLPPFEHVLWEGLPQTWAFPWIKFGPN